MEQENGITQTRENSESKSASESELESDLESESESGPNFYSVSTVSSISTISSVSSLGSVSSLSPVSSLNYNIDLSINTIQSRDISSSQQNTYQLSPSSILSSNITLRNSPLAANKYIMSIHKNKFNYDETKKKIQKLIKNDRIECICCCCEGYKSIICEKTCSANPKHEICNRCMIKQKARRCFYCNPLNDGHNHARNIPRGRRAYDITTGLRLQNFSELAQIANDSSHNIIIINPSPEYRRYRPRNSRAVIPSQYGTQFLQTNNDDIIFNRNNYSESYICFVAVGKSILFVFLLWIITVILDISDARNYRNNKSENNSTII